MHQVSKGKGIGNGKGNGNGNGIKRAVVGTTIELLKSASIYSLVVSRERERELIELVSSIIFSFSFFSHTSLSTIVDG